MPKKYFHRDSSQVHNLELNWANKYNLKKYIDPLQYDTDFRYPTSFDKTECYWKKYLSVGGVLEFIENNRLRYHAVSWTNKPESLALHILG
jgi:hypothetical protein